MTNDEFKYWINGYLSLSGEESINNHQMQIIINHANLVKSIEGSLDQDTLNLISTFNEKIMKNEKMPASDLKELLNH